MTQMQYDGQQHIEMHAEAERTSIAAILSLVLGLVGCCFGITSIPAVFLAIFAVTGMLAVYMINKHASDPGLIGLVREGADTSTPFSRLQVAQGLHNINAPDNYGDTSIPARALTFASFIPDMVAGIACARCDRPTQSSMSETAFTTRASSVPASRKGKATLSKAERCWTKRKFWNTTPIVSRRNRAR